MIHRLLYINDWDVDFIFANDEYDIDVVLEYLMRAHADWDSIQDAIDLMSGDELNTGLTCIGKHGNKAVVLVGPASSSAEMLDTLMHELLHLTEEIVSSYGYDLTGELPAYLIGDLAREFIDIVCDLCCSFLC